MSTRHSIVGLALIATVAFVAVILAPVVGVAQELDPVLVELQERTFRFFWDTANPENGLIPDRYPTPSYSSIAAVGSRASSCPL